MSVSVTRENEAVQTTHCMFRKQWKRRKYVVSLGKDIGAILTLTPEANIEVSSGESKRVIERGRAWKL